MIFKTLFTPGHKHTDPEKRKASIVKLDPSKEADKRILHELAFNDGNDAVTLAALHKLDSFALWMKSADNAHSAIVKKKAQQICIQSLAHKDKVNDSLFEAFVTESKNKHLLSTLLFENLRLQQHPSLGLQVLFSLENEQANRRFFIEIANESQQGQIVERTEDLKILGKYAKQSSHQSVISLINAKLQEAELRKVMPAKIKHSVTLINSRLLALKDTQDYEYLEQEFKQLNKAFEQSKTDFVYLDEASSAQLSEKYLGLKTLIEQKLAKLELEYQDQLLLKKTSNDLIDIQEHLKQLEQQVNLLLSSDDNEIDAQVKILSASVLSVQDELKGIESQAQTTSHQQLCKQLRAQMIKLQASLQDLPAVIAVSQQAQAIIDALHSNLTQYADTVKLDIQPMKDFEALIQNIKAEFNELQASQSLLPESKIKAFNKAVAQANKKLKAFKGFYQNLERKCENKLKVVNNMISEGKFKPAMSTFFHVQKLVETLPEPITESRNGRLRKAYESTAEEVQKLQDWQAYIAQPRKPALILEAEALAASNMYDAYARVDAVKKLRTQWSSFGQLHTDEDDALNKTFDTVIEQAFAPCRIFFASLEKLRAENLSLAQKIVKEASNIDEDTPATELASVVGGLKTRFNKVGDIDKSELRKVKRQFSEILAPLNQRINDFYAANALQKQKLVDKAMQLASEQQASDTLKEAVDTAKELQKQWKAIGFAGREQENQLWQSFRQQNDVLFSRYHESLNQQQAEHNQTLNALDSKVLELDKKVKAATRHADLSFYSDAKQALEVEIDAVDDQLKSKLLSKLEGLDTAYKSVSQKLDAAKTSQATQDLFEFLKSYTKNDLPESFDELASPYKAWINGNLNSQDRPQDDSQDILQGLSRDELVQVALIINDKAPVNVKFGDENRRKELQMQLMASKLEGKGVVLPESILAAWVSQQHVKPEDLKGLSLLEQMY